MKKNPLHIEPMHEDDYIIRDARNTLDRAEKIKSNKALMRKIVAAHQHEAQVLAKPGKPESKKKVLKPKKEISNGKHS